MASNLKMADQGVNVEADALARQLDSGLIKIYDGTQPATANTAITTQVLLATFTVPATSAPAASAGVLTFNLPANVTAAATSTATWFRAQTSGGTTNLFDGNVGTAATDMVLNSTSIVINATVAITSWTHTIPK